MGVSSLHFCTSDSWGGLELYACTLMLELKQAGSDVYAVCKPQSGVERFLREHEIRFMYLPSYAPVSVSTVRFVRSIVAQRDIGVLHTHFHRDIWPASLAVRGDSSRKLFMSVYMGVLKKNDILHRFIYGRVDGIFTSSRELNERLPRLYPVPPGKIHLLPYGRHLERYKRDEGKRESIRTRYGVRPDDILVGTMVRIDPGKGVMDFAKSFLYIHEDLRPKVRFIIVGEPTRRGRIRENESPFEPHCEAYRDELRRFIKEQGLADRIILAGFQDDLVGYLGAFDIFSFPSRDELYSLVVLDAMSMQLPVVAARAGGNLHQVKDGVSGLLFDVGSSPDLANKLEQYMRDPGLRTEHGRAAREFVRENHSMDRTIAKLLEFYHR